MSSLMTSINDNITARTANIAFKTARIKKIFNESVDAAFLAC